MSTTNRAPTATYRLQLRQGMDFRKAAGLLDYLVELGVSHVYLSPIWEAARDSQHGYDVVDPNIVDPALGGESAYMEFVGALDRAGLEHMIDIVPNHMSVVSERNRWWWDVLEKGKSSQFARAFDVDWEGPSEAGRDTVLLPILSERYGRALGDHAIHIVREQARFSVSAMGRTLPVSAESLTWLLDNPTLKSEFRELEGVTAALSPGSADTGDKLETARRVLSELLTARPELGAALDRALATVNDDPTALDEFLSRQHYRLAHYRVARFDLDYRRFFDIAELAALQMDAPGVFERAHQTLLSWIGKGELKAVRVDHPDGLRDPARYFQKLRAASSDSWIVVEKILGAGELIADDWPVDGTTGYDFLNMVGGLFVDPSAEPALDRAYDDFLAEPEPEPFETIARRAKRYVLDHSLAAELRRLTRVLQGIIAPKLEFRDFASEELRLALREVLACLDVYRTYLRPSSRTRTAEASYLIAAFDAAKSGRPDLDAGLFDHMQRLLCGGAVTDAEWDFVLRFEQLSAATMAKGLEDTAFYRYARLLSQNEVGNDPRRFSTSTEEFHRFCALMQRRWPKSLLATTTHDTKRSEDARLRISALSEFSAEWTQAVNEWSEQARALVQPPLPDRQIEYVIWQTLIAAHPLSEERLVAYLTKAMREAKQRSSWLDPDETYEASVLRFARSVLADHGLMAKVQRFSQQLQPIAGRSSLSQTLLKLTAYGVPDIYQGSEVWDTRLTDPDNRTAPDFGELAVRLERAGRASADEALSEMPSGLAKLWLIRRVLGLRRLEPSWFGPEAAYEPLRVAGPRSPHVIAFSRGAHVIVVAPRLFRTILERGYEDTAVQLPDAWYRNLFHSDARYRGPTRLEELLAPFPVALLIAERPG